MRKLTFEPIREVHFQHQVSDAFAGLRIIPDRQTQHILKNYKLQHKVIDDKFYILQTFINDAPLVPIDEKLQFRFHLYFDYLSFAHQTDIQLYNPKDSCLYIALLNNETNEHLIDDLNLIDLNPKEIKAEDITPLEGYHLNPGLLGNGVYRNTSTQLNFALYRENKRDFGGYIDVDILPGEASEANLHTIKVNPRKVYLQYVVIPKSNNYNEFSIADNENKREFIIEQQDANYIFTSKETVTIDIIQTLSFSLTAKRKNGMEITIKDNLPLPSTKNLSKYGDNQDFCLKIFFYV